MTDIVPTITELCQSKLVATSHYLACEQADRDTPYSDGRRSSRETVAAFWCAIRAIVAYKIAIDEYHRHRAFWIAVYIQSAREESESAA